ncbi:MULTISPECIES: hypothetical protein [Ruminococcus]|uniref:Phage protein n=1 Tax=Ruminococcus gauvreauii TaxID=438033 RepID=A0ABY5VG70_9FIRM|nr:MULTISPECIES: hypothetical protein [Ruminococcus]MCH1982893.1 hypothetical protein [Ruminococcus sp. OA3]UWP59018.1 hypothetical protein NQ502_16850 [Ruminococcus gauvreauii]
MKNYYSTIDNIVLTFSDVEEDKNGFDSITFRFERTNDNGFDFAEGVLPENQIYKTYGFSEDELMQMQEYLKNNSFLIWEIASEKGDKQSA